VLFHDLIQTWKFCREFGPPDGRISGTYQSSPPPPPYYLRTHGYINRQSFACPARTTLVRRRLMLIADLFTMRIGSLGEEVSDTCPSRQAWEEDVTRLGKNRTGRDPTSLANRSELNKEIRPERLWVDLEKIRYFNLGRKQGGTFGILESKIAWYAWTLPARHVSEQAWERQVMKAVLGSRPRSSG
jgi:hypothetical protein